MFSSNGRRFLDWILICAVFAALPPPSAMTNRA
jgi:hypothetical protein